MIVQRWLLAAFILLFPFYVFPSGLPQPSHAALALACLASVRPLLSMLRTPDRRVLLPLLLFTAYTTVVNGYYSITVSSPLASVPLTRSVYVAFNVAAFAVFLWRIREGGARELRFYVACAACAAVTLAIVSMAYPIGASSRLTAFFNNPNQLGYYALIVLAATLAFSLRGGLSVAAAAVVTASCVYLIARSLSMAAIVALVLLWFFVGIQALRTRPRLAAALVLSFLPLAALTWFTQGGAVLATLEQHSGRLERPFAYFVEDRHLTWLATYPEHLVLGAGEGAAERFYVHKGRDADAGGAEVHSTLGTVLFSYGIPGTVLFLLFLWRIVRENPAHTLPLVVPLLAYGVAHNGLRFTLLWFGLAVIYGTARLAIPLADVAPIALWPRRRSGVSVQVPTAGRPGSGP